MIQVYCYIAEHFSAKYRASSIIVPFYSQILFVILSHLLSSFVYVGSFINHEFYRRKQVK